MTVRYLLGLRYDLQKVEREVALLNHLLSGRFYSMRVQVWSHDLCRCWLPTV